MTKEEVLKELEQVMSFMYRELKPALFEEDYERLGNQCDDVYEKIEKIVGEIALRAQQ
jgi:hypothetical protein